MKKSRENRTAEAVEWVNDIPPLKKTVGIIFLVEQEFILVPHI